MREESPALKPQAPNPTASGPWVPTVPQPVHWLSGHSLAEEVEFGRLWDLILVSLFKSSFSNTVCKQQ